MGFSAGLQNFKSLSQILIDEMELRIWRVSRQKTIAAFQDACRSAKIFGGEFGSENAVLRRQAGM